MHGRRTRPKVSPCRQLWGHQPHPNPPPPRASAPGAVFTIISGHLGFESTERVGPWVYSGGGREVTQNLILIPKRLDI